MKDILLFKTCEICDNFLTLMESVRDDGQLCLVIRCLTCGVLSEEVAEIKG